MTIRHNQEHAHGALTRSVGETWTYLELAPVASHQSVEDVERANQEVPNQSGTLKTVCRGATRNHPCVPWHSGWSGARYRIKPSGRAPFETLKSSGEIVCFAVTIWARAHGGRDRADKFGTPWSEKIWLGKSEITDEHLCCNDGVTRHRTARRQPPATRWSLDFLDKLRENTVGTDTWIPKISPSTTPHFVRTSAYGECESNRRTQSMSTGGAPCASTAVCGHGRGRHGYEGH